MKGHLRPGTLSIVLGGTSQDIPGYCNSSVLQETARDYETIGDIMRHNRRHCEAV